MSSYRLTNLETIFNFWNLFLTQLACLIKQQIKAYQLILLLWIDILSATASHLNLIVDLHSFEKPMQSMDSSL
jgi:hypothetical protein